MSVSPNYAEANEFITRQAEILSAMELEEFFTTMHSRFYSHIDVEFMRSFVSILHGYAIDSIEANKRMKRLVLRDPSRPKCREAKPHEAKRRRIDQPEHTMRFIGQLSELLGMYAQLSQSALSAERIIF
jgi:hypothetical protein